MNKEIDELQEICQEFIDEFTKQKENDQKELNELNKQIEDYEIEIEILIERMKKWKPILLQIAEL